MRKKVVLLGSTGSVGQNACKVLAFHKDRFEVKTLVANVNYKMLLHQAAALNVKNVIVGHEDFYGRCKDEAPSDVCVQSGIHAMCECVSAPDVDIVICAILGFSALEPVIAALRHGKTVALASKEVMLLAGDIVMEKAKKYGGRIIPVDSEHSAIFQCLAMHDMQNVKSLVLTCSGGPFRGFSRKMLENVRVEDALNHPVWSMGRKITIDSASLMNKALEVVEASFLFGVEREKIKVLVHPEGIIHSLVEFADNSMSGLFSNPSMELPIQYALSYPDVLASEVAPLDLAKLGTLHFEAVDEDVFPAIRFAQRALELGHNMPLVMNCANDAAVQRFCRGEIPFVRIWDIVETAMESVPLQKLDDLDAVRDAATAAYRMAEEI